MSLWSRVLNVWQGARAGWTSYGSYSAYSSLALNHSDYATRLSDYALYEMYRQNVIYENPRFIAQAVASNRKLYKNTAGLFNSIKRLNDLYASNVYQGSLNLEDLGVGALPLAFDNEALEVPLQLILKWSNLGQQLAEYVDTAATTGDAVWNVVDDPLRQRVRLELLHPAKLRDESRDEVGNAKAGVFEYERTEDVDVARYQPARLGDVLKTTKIYTKTVKMVRELNAATGTWQVRFQTYRDGELFPFQQDMNGTWMAEWLAPYPFIPYTHAMWEPTDEGWGRNSFYASMTKIDIVNSVASQLNQSVRRVIEPILLAKNVNVAVGADGKRRLDFNVERDDSTGVSVLIVNGESADIQPLTVPLDIGSATEHIQNLLAEIERDMPILALQHIRESGAVSGAAVRNMYGDAIGQIEAARKNLDPPLVAALQMAVTIGAVRGYEGFEAFDAESYDNGDMELRVKERPVFPDELTTSERLQSYSTVAGLPPGYQRLALTDMNIPSDEIERIVGEQEASAQQTTETPATQTAVTPERLADIFQRAGVGQAVQAEPALA